jgi:hypothetical protein
MNLPSGGQIVQKSSESGPIGGAASGTLLPGPVRREMDWLTRDAAARAGHLFRGTIECDGFHEVGA